MTTITTAAREYANRPKDEQFPSVTALVTAAQEDKRLSGERAYNLKDLQVVATNEQGQGGAYVSNHDVTTLRLQSPKGTAKFTHWSFSQTCRMLGAPASYLRELPPAIAADALNFGLQDSAPGTTANLLVRANGCEPTIRACTSDSYGRLWDADLYSAVAYQLTDRDPLWSLPPVWGGGVAGAYRGDRDSFLIVTNGGSIVTDPTAGQGSDGTMYRGLMIRNSEVGASSVVIETILYRYICGNHMLWGAIYDSQFRRRHVGSHVARDVVREIGRIAFKWAHASTERDNAIIRTLIDREIAHTKDAVIDELRKMGATKDQAESAYLRCEQTEHVSPRSFWGMAQGITRLSQDASFQDERYDLDRLAALVMARGAKVAA